MYSVFQQICQGLLANRVTIKLNSRKFPLLILLCQSVHDLSITTAFNVSSMCASVGIKA